MKKISNLKFKISNCYGFTLIELIAVIGILIILTSVVVGILSYTLRLGSKSNVNDNVSQNGNYILSVISNTLTDSKKIYRMYNSPTLVEDSGLSMFYSGPSLTTVNRIIVENFDLSRYTIECVATPPGIQIIKQFKNAIPPPEYNAPMPPIPLVAPEVAIVAGSCHMEYIRPTIFDAPRVAIVFGLEQAGGVSVIERTAAANFRTEITLRNYNK